MNPYDHIVSDFNKESSNLFMLGFEIYSKLCEADRIEEITKLADFLSNEKIFFAPMEYVNSYLDGNLSEEDFYLGLGLFKTIPDLQLGIPAIAVDYKYGTEYKESKTLSQKGDVRERTYYAKSTKQDRQVIAHIFRFVDGKLDKHEDKSADTDFYTIFYEKGEGSIGCANLKEAYSITLVAFSDTEKDYKDEDFELLKQYISESVDEHLIENDSSIQQSNNWFKGHNADGTKRDIDSALESLNDMDVLEAEEINHATNVLRNAKSGMTDIEYSVYMKYLIEYGQKFLDRYDELINQMTKIPLMSTSELKAAKIPFNDTKKIIDDTYAECQTNYTANLEKSHAVIFEKEIADFREALKSAEEEQNAPTSIFDSGGSNKEEACFIATAAMGDYDHPDVVQLRLFRDRFLLKRSWGKLFTKFYYRFGPIPANFIAKSSTLKRMAYLFIVKPLSNAVSKIKYDT